MSGGEKPGWPSSFSGTVGTRRGARPRWRYSRSISFSAEASLPRVEGTANQAEEPVQRLVTQRIGGVEDGATGAGIEWDHGAAAWPARGAVVQGAQARFTHAHEGLPSSRRGASRAAILPHARHGTLEFRDTRPRGRAARRAGGAGPRAGNHATRHARGAAEAQHARISRIPGAGRRPMGRAARRRPRGRGQYVPHAGDAGPDAAGAHACHLARRRAHGRHRLPHRPRHLDGGDRRGGLRAGRGRCRRAGWRGLCAVPPARAPRLCGPRRRALLHQQQRARRAAAARCGRGARGGARYRQPPRQRHPGHLLGSRRRADHLHPRRPGALLPLVCRLRGGDGGPRTSICRRNSARATKGGSPRSTTAIAAITAFRPDALVVPLGFDASEFEPLASLKVTQGRLRPRGRGNRPARTAHRHLPGGGATTWI